MRPADEGFNLAAALADRDRLAEALTIARDVLALRAAENGDTIGAVSVCDRALRSLATPQAPTEGDE